MSQTWYEHAGETVSVPDPEDILKWTEVHPPNCSVSSVSHVGFSHWSAAHVSVHLQGEHFQRLMNNVRNVIFFNLSLARRSHGRLISQQMFWLVIAGKEQVFVSLAAMAKSPQWKKKVCCVVVAFTSHKSLYITHPTFFCHSLEKELISYCKYKKGGS